MKKLLVNQYVILRSINILLITLCLLTFANAGTSQLNSNDTASIKIQSTVQVYSGKLINSQNHQPVPYANIGIVGENIITTWDVKWGYLDLVIT